MKNWRPNFIFFLVFLFSAAITGRLFFFQILNGDFYQALSQGLHNHFGEVEKERGEIFLKNGEPLAININLPFVFASPKKIKNPKDIAQTLSQVLGLEKELILEKLKKDGLFALIKKKLTPKEVQTLKTLKLEGIYLSEERGRYYPQENLASQVIGFLGAEGKGQYGLEEAYDEELQNGTELISTIDYNVQFEAEKLLEKAKENLDIEKGQIIVIEPDSGKIIALAVFPNFNPNSYGEYAKKGDLEIFKNDAVQALFEPGSVFKPITMAAALNEEKITPQTTYQDPGEIKIGGYKIYNYEQRKYPGDTSMTEVLEKSINTGALFAQKELGGNLFLKYIEKFGFFDPTEIDLQETYSENQEIKTGREINLATASFGQGIEMTPIQLARAYSVIANGGKLVRPYLIDGLVEVKPPQPKFDGREQVISSKIASQLTAMLVSVVENGFAKRAKIPGYYIAGKTGTAQIAFSALGIDKEGYSEKTIQTFAGFAPAFNPQFLILITLNNPKTKTAEYSAVPIFHDLAEYILHYWQIPPDYE